MVVVLVEAVLEGGATDGAALRHVRLHFLLHSAALVKRKGGKVREGSVLVLVYGVNGRSAARASFLTLWSPQPVRPEISKIAKT